MPVSLPEIYTAALTDEQKQVLEDRHTCGTTIDDVNDRALHAGILQSLLEMSSDKGVGTISQTDDIPLNRKGPDRRFCIPMETLYKAGNSLHRNSPMRAKINKEIQKRFVPFIDEKNGDEFLGDMLSGGRQCGFDEILVHQNELTEMRWSAAPLVLNSTMPPSEIERMKKLASELSTSIKKHEVGALSIFDGDHHLGAFCTKESDDQRPEWIVIDSHPSRDNEKQIVRHSNVKKLLGDGTVYISNDMQKNAPNACIPIAVMLRIHLSTHKPKNCEELKIGVNNFLVKWGQLTPGQQKSKVNKMRLKLLDAMSDQSLRSAKALSR